MTIRRTTRAVMCIAAALALATSHAEPLTSALCFYSGSDHRTQAEAAEAMMRELSQQYNFALTITTDSRVFNDAELAKHQVVIINNLGYWSLPISQATAFQNYIRNGGGTVAWHMSGANHNAWAWYQDLVGSTNIRHSAIVNAQLYTEQDNRNHPILAGIPETFTLRDEWYNYSPDPADNPNMTILVLVDESSYSGGTMGSYHPVAWCQEFEGGRSYFHNMSHVVEMYDDENVRKLVVNALYWAAGDEGTPVRRRPSRRSGSPLPHSTGVGTSTGAWYRIDGSVAAAATTMSRTPASPLQVYVAEATSGISQGTQRGSLVRAVR